MFSRISAYFVEENEKILKKKNLKESHIKSGGIFTCRVLVFGYSILKRVLRIRQFPKAHRRASRDEPTVDAAVSGV